jgi:hypothetical protein
MIDVIPRTPQELAAEILLIAEKGEHFNMSRWWSSEYREERLFLPAAQQELDCGTTMCAAGWALHLTGWDLRIREREGFTSIAMAENPTTGETGSIHEVAARALGLTSREAESLFHTSAPIAIELLRQLADGRPFDDLGAYRTVHHLEETAT